MVKQFFANRLLCHLVKGGAPSRSMSFPLKFNISLIGLHIFDCLMLQTLASRMSVIMNKVHMIQASTAHYGPRQVMGASNGVFEYWYLALAGPGPAPRVGAGPRLGAMAMVSSLPRHARWPGLSSARAVPIGRARHVDVCRQPRRRIRTPRLMPKSCPSGPPRKKSKRIRRRELVVITCVIPPPVGWAYVDSTSAHWHWRVQAPSPLTKLNTMLSRCTAITLEGGDTSMAWSSGTFPNGV